MKGVVKKMCFPSYSLFHRPACAVLCAFVLCVFVSGAAGKSRTVVFMVHTDSHARIWSFSFGTGMSYHVSETQHRCTQCWPGIHRITVGKQYCKYQWHTHQPSVDIGFRCIEAFSCFQCFNPLRHQLQYMPLWITLYVNLQADIITFYSSVAPKTSVFALCCAFIYVVDYFF